MCIINTTIYLCPKFIAELLKFFISDIELCSSVRPDFIELAFISEAVMCWSRCDELCTRWLVAALLDVVLETICRGLGRIIRGQLLCNVYIDAFRDRPGNVQCVRRKQASVACKQVY